MFVSGVAPIEEGLHVAEAEQGIGYIDGEEYPGELLFSKNARAKVQKILYHSSFDIRCSTFDIKYNNEH